VSVGLASQRLAGQAVAAKRSINRRTRLVAITAAVVIAGMAAAVVAGGSRWTRETQGATARLMDSLASPTRVVPFAELEALPAPVQRYLKMALSGCGRA
jgi:hypothetical protein